MNIYNSFVKKFVQSSKPLVLVLQKLIFNSLIVFTTSGEFHQLRGFNHILLMCSAASLAFLKQILFLNNWICICFAFSVSSINGSILGSLIKIVGPVNIPSKKAVCGYEHTIILDFEIYL